MHILFLTDNFPPEVNAPASRTFEHCLEWVEEGHRVTIITCAPNFPKGRVFDGYRNRLWQQEELAGIRVVRVWSYIAANEGFTKRILDYVSFFISGVLASLFIRKVDLVVGTSPQFFVALAAFVTGQFKRVPWVFELRDIWPESIRAVGAMKESAVLDLLEKLEVFLYHRATVIVSVTNAFRDSLISRGVDASKIHVITNGVDTTRFSPREKDLKLVEKYGLEHKFVAGYIGTHGLAHALDTILEAAKKLKSHPNSDHFRIILLGDGAKKDELKLRALTEELDNVIFIDSVTKDEVVHYWSLLDVSIIHLKRNKLFTTVIPSKLFECMGMAVPLLHGVEGESADIVVREGVGLLFEPENADELVEGLVTFYTNSPLHLRAKEKGPLAAKKYDRSVLARKMLQILENTVSS